jgi:hypothetical protein
VGMEPERGNGWTDEIPTRQWRVYRRVIRGLRAIGIPFALGGAFALATYTGRWRNTKDLDIYIFPAHRKAAIEVVNQAGLEDFFEVESYVREWIYRAYVRGARAGNVIVDLIWAMANERAEVDERWLEGGPSLKVRGEILQAVPAEEMIWAKLYVLQKERTDWVDVFNLLCAEGERLDWELLLGRLGPDTPLLSGALSVFAWLTPEQAQRLPGWLWERLGLARPQPHPSPEITRRRANLLDSRPWFHPLIAED